MHHKINKNINKRGSDNVIKTSQNVIKSVFTVSHLGLPWSVGISNLVEIFTCRVSQCVGTEEPRVKRLLMYSSDQQTTFS